MNEEGRVWTVSCNDMQGPCPQPFEGLEQRSERCTVCGLYLASSNNPRKMSSYTLTPNAYLMQESIQTLRFIRSEMIWIQIILIEIQIRRDMKKERYWLKFTNWHKLCHIVDSVLFFTSVQNSVFKCWIRSTAITYVHQIKTCMKSFRFVPLSKQICLE